MSTTTGNAAPTFRFPRFAKAFRRIVAVLIVAGIVVYALRALLGIYTHLLWFDSVSAHSVYTRVFATETVLFVMFGGLTAAALAVNLLIAVHRRGAFDPDQGKQRWRWRYHRYLHGRRRWLIALVAVWLGVWIGSTAASSWQAWLLWRHPRTFHIKDPQFHRDISYYVMVYPLHRLVLSLLVRIVVLSIVAVVVAGYLYGGIRIRGTGPRMTRALLAQLSLLGGLLLVLKAFAYRLDMFTLATSSRGVGTGWGYTDVHAAIPGKWVLLVVAGLLALVLFANTYLRSARLLLLGVGMMALAAFVFGVAIPGLVQQFRDKPSAASLEIKYIARNIAATQTAYGLTPSAVTSEDYAGKQDAPSTSVRTHADTVAQYRLLDPNRLSATFTQLEQLNRSFYGFKSTLDVDRYPIGGRSSDVVLALRELNLSGLASSQQSWVNRHLVYTHGYGVVAAETDKQTPSDTPAFIDGSSANAGALRVSQPGVYYGQMSPSYSIVGAPPGSPPLEFDRPLTSGAGALKTTHVGPGGISLGSDWRRLVYALRFHSAGILFSSDINRDSQLLTVRNPRARVAAVAPWLTLDGDAYPTVVNGRILWVVDGYTTTNNYPYSQTQNLRSDTTNTYTSSGSTVTQPKTSINYMRNSVKATVDAYTGKVTLYAWNQNAQPDPILQTWEAAFPGLVQPQSAIPPTLLPHLRYPQDLFNVQRSVETRYHPGTTPEQYYNGSDFWTVPQDPTVSATSSINSLGKKVSGSAPSQPSIYMTLSPNGSSPAVFSLSSPLVTLSSRNLAAFLSVDSQPGPNYGHFTLLQLPSGSNSVASPSQVQSNIESDSTVASSLSLLRSGHSKVLLGNLMPVPLDGKMLWVEPIYEQAIGGSTSSYPLLRKVIAYYNNISYETRLSDALTGAIGGSRHQSASAQLQQAVTQAQQAEAAIRADIAAGNSGAETRDEQSLQRALARIAAGTLTP